VERAGHVPARQPEPNSTLTQLRVNNHELHLLFARAMSAAADHEPLPADAAGGPTGSSFWPVDRSSSTGRPAGRNPTGPPQHVGTAPRRNHAWIAHCTSSPVPDRGRSRGIRRFGAGHRACILGDVRRSVGLAPGFDWVRTLATRHGTDDRHVGRTTAGGPGSDGAPSGLWLAGQRRCSSRSRC
jgi:hypothetical protein